MRHDFEQLAERLVVPAFCSASEQLGDRLDRQLDQGARELAKGQIGAEGR
jgi:cation transport regulator ChaB